MPVRVLIADDHPVVRQGLRSFLSFDYDIEVVGEAVDGAQALSLAHHLQPNVVLMDVLMPVMDGVTATRLIRQQLPQVQVLVLTSVTEDAPMIEALEAGAVGYLLKDADVQELRRAIRSASCGEPYVSARVAKALAAPDAQAHRASLTDREMQILQLLGRGYSNKEIAASLHIGLPTVKTHVSTILSKLGVASRTQAALRAQARTPR